MIGIGIKGLTSVEGNNTDLKSENTVTEWTAWGFLWPSLDWRCLVSRFVFSCVVTPSSPRRSVLRVYWKFHALHWFFCFGFLKTWERPKTSSPESKELDCELASESIYMRWADIFNSRYFASANLIWNSWQNKGLLDAKGRIQVFPRWFRANFLNFRIGVTMEWVTSQSRSRHNVTSCLSSHFFLVH